LSSYRSSMAATNRCVALSGTVTSCSSVSPRCRRSGSPRGVRFSPAVVRRARLVVLARVDGAGNPLPFLRRQERFAAAEHPGHARSGAAAGDGAEPTQPDGRPGPEAERLDVDRSCVTRVVVAGPEVRPGGRLRARTASRTSASVPRSHPRQNSP
jgi:hypothetical protein